VRWKELGSKDRGGWGTTGRSGTQSCRRRARTGSGERLGKQEEKTTDERAQLSVALSRYFMAARGEAAEGSNDYVQHGQTNRYRKWVGQRGFHLIYKGMYWYKSNCKEGSCSNRKHKDQ